jgi:hypothetical protein
MCAGGLGDRLFDENKMRSLLNNFIGFMVPPARLERAAYRLGICRSILLSYGGRLEV